MEKLDKVTHFIAVIRHGERGDSVPGFKVENKDDPLLTPKGMKQAFATGVYLKKYFKDNNLLFDKIIIESSPFIRCMMTSA